MDYWDFFIQGGKVMYTDGVSLDFQEPVIFQQSAPTQQAPVQAQAPAVQAPPVAVSFPEGAGRDIEVDRETLTGAVEIANRALSLAGTNTSLRHTMHAATNQFYISLVNNETNEIIREIPPRASLDRFAAILELAGLLVDQRQ